MTNTLQLTSRKSHRRNFTNSVRELSVFSIVFVVDTFNLIIQKLQRKDHDLFRLRIEKDALSITVIVGVVPVNVNAILAIRVATDFSCEKSPIHCRISCAVRFS